MKIFKIGQIFDLQRFLPRSAKKTGELWSTNHGRIEVESYPPKSTFSGDYISAFRGLRPKFLHALENEQVLLAHFPERTGVSLTIFKGGQKLA